MKIRLHFKTPDVVDFALDDHFPDCHDENRRAAKAVCDKFVKYDENITVEVDTETGQATVVPVR